MPIERVLIADIKCIYYKSINKLSLS